MTILIVDDDQDQCESLADVLNDVGYDVDTASSGKQAVELASRKPYVLMLLDLRMLGMDGIEAFRRMKEADGRARGLLLTAFATVEAMRCAKELGMDEVISKPLDLPILLSRIGRVLSHN
jgi:Response regulator containing CheY-like receiver, AAA-type ATPase, and DNA-binding domains